MSEFKRCPSCRTDIIKTLKHCPFCGVRQVNPFLKYKAFIVIIILVVLGVIGFNYFNLEIR